MLRMYRVEKQNFVGLVDVFLGLFALYYLQRVRRADVGQTDTRFLCSTRKRGSCVCVGVR